MNKNWLYVSDLDGTLLTPGGQLSPYALTILTELQDQGAAITVASGRNLTSIKAALGSLEIKLPLISSDGALISTYTSPAPLFAFTMPREDLDRLLFRLLKEEYSPLMDVWSGERNYTAVKDLTNKAMVVFKGQKTAEPEADFAHVPDLRTLLDQEILSITVMDTEERVARVKAIVDEFPELKTDSMGYPGLSGYALAWIQNRRARKEEALEKLMEFTGFPRERVVVFGDELNDLGMFKSGCRAVAVANARPELKSLAHHIIGPHHEEAVPHWIRDHFYRQGRGDL